MASFEHVCKHVMEVTDADLEKKTTVVGRTTTYWDVYLMFATHAYEHLGQSIAYTRMNDTTPPWSGRGH